MKVILWAAKVRTFVRSAARWPLTIVATDRSGCRMFLLRVIRKDSRSENGTIKIFLVHESLHLGDDTHRLRRFSIVILTMTELLILYL